MRSRPILRLEDKIEGERALLEGLSRPSERRWGIAAALAAILLVPSVALLPRPTGASTPPAGDADSGDWTTVVRGMPPPPAPAEVPASPAATSRGTPPPAPVRLDTFHLPEPIPEPATTPFLPLVPTREPEAPLGTPEPPPAEEEAGSPEEPAVETVPPQVAPGGKVQPNYPIAARSLRLSGSVKLEVQVDAAGTVTGVRVVGTDRPGVGFEEAAARAVERWRFVPATRGAVPVPGSAVVEVEFRW